MKTFDNCSLDKFRVLKENSDLWEKLFRRQLFFVWLKKFKTIFLRISCRNQRRFLSQIQSETFFGIENFLIVLEKMKSLKSFGFQSWLEPEWSFINGHNDFRLWAFVFETNRSMFSGYWQVFFMEMICFCQSLSHCCFVKSFDCVVLSRSNKTLFCSSIFLYWLKRCCESFSEKIVKSRSKIEFRESTKVRCDALLSRSAINWFCSEILEYSIRFVAAKRCRQRSISL